MEFGKCFSIEDCSYRHELTKYDIPEDNLLVSGSVSSNSLLKLLEVLKLSILQINFKVLSILSPTHYTVRLLKHQAEGSKVWKKIKGSDEYLKFNLQFAQYYLNSDNHQMHWPIEVGDLCVVSEADAYYRAKVLFVTKK